MKKRFFTTFLFSVFFIFPAFAEYTNTVSSEYDNEEYKANGSALSAIGADKAYTGATGAYSGFAGTGVTVAVVDGGTLTSHPDLTGQISSLQKNEFNISGNDHGTHVSGIIAAAKNDSGMHGVAYDADLLVFSTLLEGGCGDEEQCMDPDKAWDILMGSDYDEVKIINNSWGTPAEDIDESSKNRIDQLTAMAAEKDKLIVAAAGNEMLLNPDPFPAGAGVSNPSFKNNIISVVAYDADKLPSDERFIASFSNLAGDAKEWTLAAPGTDIYSSVTYDTSVNPDAPKFNNMSGTSMAAPMVSGAAALVQQAFPYLGGKQIADVLFSTAFKKEDLDLSPYMIQSNAGLTRVLFFKDNKLGITFEQAKAMYPALAAQCGNGSVSCHEVTFEDVFGQGLLNVGDAVKGIKYFDANRLTVSDYDTAMNQFFYSVDTLGTNSTWSNDIGQVKAADGLYAQADVGLKKQGEGTLTLAGTNTFSGASVVEGGELNLTGSMAGDVVVNAGTFSMSGTAKMNGKLTTAANGLFRIDSGTLNNTFENRGTTLAAKGTAAGDIINTGTFSVVGLADTAATIDGDFSSTGRFINRNMFNFEEKGLFRGTLDNEGIVAVSGSSRLIGQINNTASGSMVVNAGVIFNNGSNPIENAGFLSGFGTIAGTVNNTAAGSVATSLTINELNSSGNIVMVSLESGAETAVMQVDTLNITGGGLTVANNNISYENGQRYTLINFNNLTAFENFATQSMLSDFIVATTHQESGSIDVTIDYLRMGESAATASFLPEEKVVAGIMDKMYLDNNNTDFKGYYYLSGENLQKEIKTIRSKVKPLQKEHLPLTNVMSSQISAHLFRTNMNRDAAVYRHQYVPMQQYRGKYYRGRSGGSSAVTENKIWGQVLGGKVVEDGDSSLNKGDVKTKTIGGMFGYDHEFSPQLLVGVTAGFASGRLTQDSDEINVKDYRAGIYTGSRFGRLTLNSMLMGGFQQYKSSRYTEIAGMGTLSRADFNGYSAEFDLNLGYDFMRLPYRDYSFYLRSYLAANVSYISQDSYEEKGASSLLLGVKSINNTSVSVQPGITIGYTFSQAVLTADFGYQRILSGDSVQTSAYFLADTAKTAFDSLSAETDKDYFNAGIGLKTNLSRSVLLNLWAGARISDNTEALNFAVSLSYAF